MAIGQWPKKKPRTEVRGFPCPVCGVVPYGSTMNVPVISTGWVSQKNS